MWMYDNFGLDAAIKSAGYDIIATLAYPSDKLVRGNR